MDEKNIFAEIPKVCLKNFVIVLHRTMIETSLNFYMVSYNPAYMVELKKVNCSCIFRIIWKKRTGGKSDQGVKNETLAKLREFLLILGELQNI